MPKHDDMPTTTSEALSGGSLGITRMDGGHMPYYIGEDGGNCWYPGGESTETVVEAPDLMEPPEFYDGDQYGTS